MASPACWIFTCSALPIVAVVFSAVSLVISAQVDTGQPQERTQDLTSFKWQLFRDAHFTIEYPTFAKVSSKRTVPPEVRIRFVEPFRHDGANGIDKFSFVIVTHANNARRSLREWKAAHWHPDEVRDERERTINGHTALAFTYTGPGDVENFVIVGDSDRVFELRYPAILNELHPTVQSRYRSVFARMVESFQPT